jgi:hypothetical protein
VSSFSLLHLMFFKLFSLVIVFMHYSPLCLTHNMFLFLLHKLSIFRIHYSLIISYEWPKLNFMKWIMKLFLVIKMNISFLWIHNSQSLKFSNILQSVYNNLYLPVDSLVWFPIQFPGKYRVAELARRVSLTRYCTYAASPSLW